MRQLKFNGALSKFIDRSNTDSPGEITFFDKIKNIKSSKNIVFHSLDIRKHISNFMGEIDFLTDSAQQKFYY